MVLKKIQTLSKKIGQLVSVGALLSVAAPGIAEETGFTITPMVGHMVFGDNGTFDGTTTYSLAGGYKFDSPWAIELAYLTGKANQDNSSNEFDLEQIRLDGLYYFESDTNLRPYLVFGAGQNSFELDDLGEDSSMLNGGFGLKYAFNTLFSLRGDIRAIRNLDLDRTDATINLGAQFLFGGSKSPSKPAPVVEPVAVLDGDNDGVIDAKDQCPNSMASDTVDMMGCAVNMDVDGDGVANAQDSCPDTKAGAKVDETGCYLMLKEDVTVQLNVNFANNSDEIVSGADQIKEVADFMRQYPLTSVVVEGHTDSRGSEAYNQSLSQKRAAEVAAQLVSVFGIDKSRVNSVGYGEANPIASNETAAGRASNRRVSAVVSATVEKPSE